MWRENVADYTDRNGLKDLDGIGEDWGAKPIRYAFQYSRGEWIRFREINQQNGKI